MPAMGDQAPELLDLVNASIFVRDLRGRISGWNKRSEDLYGCPRAAAIGRHVDEVLDTRYPKPLAELEACLLRTGCWEGDLVRTTQKGEIVVEAQWSLRRDGAGAPLDVVESGHDITASRKAFDALRESE